MKRTLKFWSALLILGTYCTLAAESFSLLTSNVLMHSHYINYSNKWIIGVEDRIASFNEEMSQAKAQNIDILCFQEWPYGHQTINKTDEITIINHKPAKTCDNYYPSEITSTKNSYNQQSIDQFQQNMSNIIEQHFPSDHYYHLKDPCKKERDGIFMVINKKKFSLLKTSIRTLYADDHSYFSGKILYAAHLAFNENPKKTIAVMTTHIPYNAYAVKNFHLLKEVIDSFDANGTVICGDFNFNSWNNESKSLLVQPINILKNIFKNCRLNVDDLPYPTAKNGSDNSPLLLDYVIYSESLKPVNNTITPEELTEYNLDRLIAHTTSSKPTVKNFYSDHAALTYTFDLLDLNDNAMNFNNCENIKQEAL